MTNIPQTALNVPHMALTDVRIRNAKPAEKPYKLADGDGMSLLVHPILPRAGSRTPGKLRAFHTINLSR